MPLHWLKGYISFFMSRNGDSNILSRNVSNALYKMFLVPDCFCKPEHDGSSVFTRLFIVTVGQSVSPDGPGS